MALHDAVSSMLLKEENFHSPQKDLPGSLNHIIPKDVDVFIDTDVYVQIKQMI